MLLMTDARHEIRREATIALADLRRFAIRRHLFTPTTLTRAIQALGFVQADPIRAPARAQDLTLWHRVRHYRAGDLDRKYATLDIEEDFFINYGFLPRALDALMHPRVPSSRWTMSRNKRERDLLAFVRERGTVHPRDVDEHFAHGKATNYWGGTSNATTHLLQLMQYRGLLRVVRREGGIRLYAARERAAAPLDAAERRERIDALVDVVVLAYAPLPAASLSMVIGRLRYAVPQWKGELKAALARARHRLAHLRADGVEWYWPAEERVGPEEPRDDVRLLGPFDPIVWDRRRFELFWGWAYRFEAYTPASKRKLGYYALPLLWRDDVIGWANVSLRNGGLEHTAGYVASAPRERAFVRALEAELERMRVFLGVEPRNVPGNGA
jgi:uncharacterized protein